MDVVGVAPLLLRRPALGPLLDRLGVLVFLPAIFAALLGLLLLPLLESFPVGDEASLALAGEGVNFWGLGLDSSSNTKMPLADGLTFLFFPKILALDGFNS